MLKRVPYLFGGDPLNETGCNIVYICIDVLLAELESWELLTTFSQICPDMRAMIRAICKLRYLSGLRAPGMYIYHRSTLGPKVYEKDLLWAIWDPHSL